ncbi:MAG TPA: hypothetical protein VJK49_08060 [Candidatus Limnocylindrales bacterium]|nr:hypothetical protein [Candidatus Limnocylindrales bacterium]
MSQLSRARQRGAARAKERELRMVREAIAMVAMGASPRVVLAGIRHGDDILVAARRLALEAGVRVNRLRQQEDKGTDLAVEPIYE